MDRSISSLTVERAKGTSCGRGYLTTSPLLKQLRLEAEQRELDILSPFASFSKKHSRERGAEQDHRLPYKRDVDRIVHSKAYVRYVDKTQVVYLVDNDHITQRSLHVQLVSNFARGIAEILRLNLDLVEAISLGHDVGHSPFGHEGEGYLSALSEKSGNGAFCHPCQSCRLFSEIEPLNLGFAVLDGFLCHDGGMVEPRYVPNYGKSWDDHYAEMERKRFNPNDNIMPATLEGALVKLSDTISYIGRDIEDGISLGIIKRGEVPKTHLGDSNREILSNLSQEIIEHSYEKEYIALSQRSFNALKSLRAFNFKKIYSHPSLKIESKKVEMSFKILFDFLLKDLQEKGEKSVMAERFLRGKEKRYLEKSSAIQQVIDYISGMTDRFFLKSLEGLFLPSKIELGG